MDLASDNPSVRCRPPIREPPEDFLKRQAREPSTFSCRLRKRLDMYALAASAAGVGMLASSQAADAKIVYRHTHRVLGPNQQYFLDFGGDGATDFTLRNYFATVTFHPLMGYSRNQLVAIDGAPGNNAVGGNNGTWYLAGALRSGSRVGKGAHFQKGGILLGGRTTGLDWGYWYNAGDRYLGLKFKIGGKTHYGWARLTVTGKYGTIKATLTGYAYETIPSKAIITGKTKGSDVITLQPGSLGRLAQGSDGRLEK
jgi:hypothetical protein